MGEYTSDEDEAEGLSVAEVDFLTKVAAAWKAVSEALDENAQGRLSAADVCAVGFAMQERVKDETRVSWGDMFRGPIL